MSGRVFAQVGAEASKVAAEISRRTGKTLMEAFELYSRVRPNGGAGRSRFSASADDRTIVNQAERAIGADKMQEQLRARQEAASQAGRDAADGLEVKTIIAMQISRQFRVSTVEANAICDRVLPALGIIDGDAGDGGSMRDRGMVAAARIELERTGKLVQIEPGERDQFGVKDPGNFSPSDRDRDGFRPGSHAKPTGANPKDGAIDQLGFPKQTASRLGFGPAIRLKK